MAMESQKYFSKGNARECVIYLFANETSDVE